MPLEKPFRESPPQSSTSEAMREDERSGRGLETWNTCPDCGCKVERRKADRWNPTPHSTLWWLLGKEGKEVKYIIAEKFKSIQGEGVYAGTPMAFIRFVGCSVGKTVCQHCDTDFNHPLGWRGGGEFPIEGLLAWAKPYQHICLTGGEPFDQSLLEFYERHATGAKMVHIETSGTKGLIDMEFIGRDPEDNPNVWVCVSPKPGFNEWWIRRANEVKVIVPSLGNGPGWPGLGDAERWVDEGKIVFLQPRNGKYDIDKINLKYVQDLIAEYPQFRLSVQMHKVLGVQ